MRRDRMVAWPAALRNVEFTSNLIGTEHQDSIIDQELINDQLKKAAKDIKAQSATLHASEITNSEI